MMRMMPTCERFDAHKVAGGQIDDGLVVQLEVVVLQCLVEVAGHVELFGCACGKHGREHA